MDVSIHETYTNTSIYYFSDVLATPCLIICDKIENLTYYVNGPRVFTKRWQVSKRLHFELDHDSNPDMTL